MTGNLHTSPYQPRLRHISNDALQHLQNEKKMKTWNTQKCWAYSDLSHGHSCRKSYVKPPTRPPDSSATGLNSPPDSGTSFSGRFRGPKAVNDVRSCASAQNTGTRTCSWIYGADFWSMCQRPKVTLYAHLKSSRKLLSLTRKTHVDKYHWYNAKQRITTAWEDKLLSFMNQTYVRLLLASDN